jgi:lactate dehydrogenase-like 2-hydroxyacid dehydrogenase
MFRLAKPLDMTSIAHDPRPFPTLAAELGVELVDLDSLFRRADVVCINCPLTPQTRHLVNAERLSLLKPTAFLINTARGGIVDQRALTAALATDESPGRGSTCSKRSRQIRAIRYLSWTTW